MSARGYAAARMGYNPSRNRRPRDLYGRLAYDLTFAKEPSAVLDERILAVAQRFKVALKRAAFTAELSAAVSLLPRHWWWHVSHMHASVTPTTPVEGAESVLSNAGRYDDQGSPVHYDTLVAWEYDRLALALCASLFTALAALKKRKREERIK